MSPNSRRRAEEEAHVRDVLEALGGSQELFERTRRKPVSIQSEPLPVRVAAQTPGYSLPPEPEEPEPEEPEAAPAPPPPAPKPRRRRAPKPVGDPAVPLAAAPEPAEAEGSRRRRPRVTVPVPGLGAPRDRLSRARGRLRRQERERRGDEPGGADENAGEVLSAEQRNRVALYTMKDSSSRP